jgi:hypothetical protein
LLSFSNRSKHFNLLTYQIHKKMTTYLEITDEKFAIQISNFATKLDLYAADFALTPAETDGLKADALFFAWTINNFKKVDTYKKNWTSFKNILRKGESNVSTNTTPQEPILDQMPTAVAPGITTRFTTTVNRIKAHPAYSSAIGQNLGIELTATQQTNRDTAQPTLKVVLRGGSVNLIWKKGKMHGILIEKDSGNGFITLDKDFHPDFIDSSPLPPHGQTALWRYRAIYILNDEKVGQWSDIVSTSVMG